MKDRLVDQVCGNCNGFCLIHHRTQAINPLTNTSIPAGKCTNGEGGTVWADTSCKNGRFEAKEMDVKLQLQES